MTLNNQESVFVKTLNNNFIFIKLNGINYNPNNISIKNDVLYYNSLPIYNLGPNGSSKFSIFGSLFEVYNNQKLVENMVDKIPKYAEKYVLEDGDEGWTRVPFIDETGREFKFMGFDSKYIKDIGDNYVNYNMPIDVIDQYPLYDVMDSFKTMLAKNKLSVYGDDYIILMELK